jgi:hypothetical protein
MQLPYNSHSDLLIDISKKRNCEEVYFSAPVHTQRVSTSSLRETPATVIVSLIPGLKPLLTYITLRRKSKILTMPIKTLILIFIVSTSHPTTGPSFSATSALSITSQHKFKLIVIAVLALSLVHPPAFPQAFEWPGLILVTQKSCSSTPGKQGKAFA